MVITESEMISQGDVESSLPAYQQPKNNPFSSLGRQSSIYSLTLDEFQHTLCESGKNFGSMNMDEFLASIWTAEENQAVNSTATTATTTNNAVNSMSSHAQLSLIDAHTEKGISKQPSLPQQGSLTLPAPLCRKTVEEVWSEIHKGQQGTHQNNNSSNDNGDNVHNPESAPRQPTFGEMTLEDFLVKAGVVREPSCALPVSQSQPLQQYGVYQNNNPTEAPSFVNRPIAGLGGAAGCVSAGGGAGGVSAGASVPTYQTMPLGGGAIGESSGYAGNGKRSGGYPPPPQPPPVYYGGRVVNGGGGYGAPSAMVVAPVSPVSSDGLCKAPVDNSGNQFGLDMGGLRGRKRIIDAGPVEKVAERRQRRMIKNRESAARSRARKQYCEEMKTKVQTKAQKDKERLRVLRRNLSCPL
ncbi:hypothetical protein F2P56_010182 [Juglans regia]|uniref:BZIP domain-containing protein n=2 Tax=Juglans regia TaxID=51240 RepID=A0A833Y1D7_JUGRE|nr:protein ABSCISIC ACID-INSENSITIVE 5-like isoform X3 [Juglans regia]KAF5473580.1 hypothetical protein F2P56_010182 [Juglans regia]